MTQASLWCLALLLGGAWAAPHPAQKPFEASNVRAGGAGNETTVKSPSDEYIVSLLHRYAPVIKLSAVEAFYPSSVEYMLAHYNYTEGDPGDTSPLDSSDVTNSTLYHVRPGSFLSIQEPHNPQPLLLDEESQYLFGPAALEGLSESDDGRGRIEEPVYGFGVYQGRGIVDLWYWTFYPFNYGKPIGPFGVLGNHVGDWEHLRMRTIDGTPVSADFTTHTGGRFNAGTFRWQDMELIDGRPVAYAAAGSHGIWPTPGDHIYAHVGRFFSLVDITDDEGPLWDTKGHVIPAVYWDGPDTRRKTWHRDDLGWMNFRGFWGNRGDTDCWWHRAVPYCQLVDAPYGPNRYFGIPPDCTIAPLADGASTYSFHFAPPAITWAEDHGVSLVQVEQVCTKPTESGGDDDEEETEETGHSLDDAGPMETWDDAVEGKLQVWTVRGSTEFKGSDQHTVIIDACKGRRSAVRAYKLSFCLPNGRCISTSKERRLCTYEEGKKGFRFGGAVDLDDVDDWRWAF
ncbi:hypothetical protein IAU60_004519 [Kwoniella sp. DSM 27419]